MSDDSLMEKLALYVAKSSIVNNGLTAADVEGMVLDARQANENIEGTLASKLRDLNSDIQPTSGALSINDKGSGTITYTKVANIVFLMLSNVSVTQKESPYTYIADLTHPPSGTLYQDCIDSQGIIFRITLNSNGLGIQYTGDSPPYFYGIIAYTL